MGYKNMYGVFGEGVWGRVGGVVAAHATWEEKQGQWSVHVQQQQ